MKLEELIGPMLGADFLFAHGELEEKGEDATTAHTHRFWGYRRDYWRTERSDGVTFVESPDGSATTYRRQVLEQSTVRPGPGFHLAERLLRPVHAPIWGRPGDDWRLCGAPEVVRESGLLRIGLVETEQPADPVGHVDVDPVSGRLWNLTTTSFSWELRWLTEESDSDHPETIFSLPTRSGATG